MAPSDQAEEKSAAKTPAAKTADEPADTKPPVAVPDNVAVAYFAGGCFWGVEHYMQQLDGVVDVEAGYMGGHVEGPSYEEVAAQKSGHFETVRVRYDPAKIEYPAIAKRFFEIHDPTQKDGQGPDIGPEYRSAVFVATDAERKAVEGLIETLRGRGYDVATEIRDADRFFRAEDRHQDYYARTGKEPYCHSRVRRFDD